MSSSEYCRRAIFQIYNVQNLKITRITTFRICNVVEYTKRGPGGIPSVFLIFYVFFLKEHFMSLIT